MRRLLHVLMPAALMGCASGHAVILSAPSTPNVAFRCASQTITAMGFTITSSEPAKGAILAERLAQGSEPGVNGLKYFTTIEVEIYTDQDAHTRLLAKPGRLKQDGTQPRTDAGVMVRDVDQAAADSVARACGSH